MAKINEIFTTQAKNKIKQGRLARTNARKIAGALATALGLDRHQNVKTGPIKDLRRILEKAVRKKINIGDINDVCRTRIFFTDPQQILDLRKLLNNGKFNTPFSKQWEKKGYYFQKMDDYFWEPKKHGAVGLDLKIKVPLTNGRSQIIEIQFMHKNMQNTDKITHAQYQDQQKKIALAKKEERDLYPYEQAIIDDYQAVARCLYETDIINYGLGVLMKTPPTRRPDSNGASNNFDTLS